MTAATWARIGLIWSACWLVFSLVHAASAASFGLALVHTACALAHLGLCVWAVRVGRLSRRLQARVAAHRCADHQRLRADAWLGIWTDRVATHGWRHPLTMAAHLSTVQSIACYEVAVAGIREAA